MFIDAEAERLQRRIEASEADNRRLRARLAGSEARVRELEGALENIHLNVKGLVNGMVPTMSQDAVWYFKMIEHICNAALRGAEGNDTAERPELCGEA